MNCENERKFFKIGITWTTSLDIKFFWKTHKTTHWWIWTVTKRCCIDPPGKLGTKFAGTCFFFEKWNLLVRKFFKCQLMLWQQLMKNSVNSFEKLSIVVEMLSGSFSFNFYVKKLTEKFFIFAYYIPWAIKKGYSSFTGTLK